MQAEVNIGMLGHVDHGKTSITKCLTGKWTDTHSEEIKRGISIRIGYADATFRKCSKCPEPEAYTTQEKCPKCGGEAEVLRTVSFLDAPGHETLMTTAIAASSIMDGAVLVIAANEECPQPQSMEHLMVLEVLGVRDIVVVQNKVDLVPREKAVENYNQIRKFLQGSVAEKAPIVPFVANKCANADALMAAIDKSIPTPERDLKASPQMYVARSFDINKPGTGIGKLAGGVVGGSLIRGVLKAGDEVELRPGVMVGEKGKAEKARPLKIKVERLFAGGEKLEEARPGGLVAIGTLLDPAITKSDRIVGSMLGKSRDLPPLVSEIDLAFKFLERFDMAGASIKQNEPLVLSIGTATAIGFVEGMKKNVLRMKLKRPICVLPGSKIAVSRRVGKRWRLAGYGTLKE